MTTSHGDMSRVIEVDSTQINADDLMSGPQTFTVAGVKIKSGKDQPVEISLKETDKFFRPCKTVCRVLVAGWGADSSTYAGKSFTLYCDPKVRWGGLEVGGLRVSHMSHLDTPLTLALTVTRGSKKPYTVKPLTAAAPKPASKPISAAQHKRLEARINEVGADRDKLKAYVLEKFGCEHLNEMSNDAYDAVDKMLDKKAAADTPTDAQDSGDPL